MAAPLWGNPPETDGGNPLETYGGNPPALEGGNSPALEGGNPPVPAGGNPPIALEGGKAGPCDVEAGGKLGGLAYADVGGKTGLGDSS